MTTRRSWDEFVAAIAGVAQTDPTAISRSTRLDEDLALDSLALTEVIVTLIVDFEMGTVAEDLTDREWRGVTVGGLYDEYTSGQRSTTPTESR